MTEDSTHMTEDAHANLASQIKNFSEQIVLKEEPKSEDLQVDKPVKQEEAPAEKKETKASMFKSYPNRGYNNVGRGILGNRHRG